MMEALEALTLIKKYKLHVGWANNMRRWYVGGEIAVDEWTVQCYNNYAKTLEEAILKTVNNLETPQLELVLED